MTTDQIVVMAGGRGSRMGPLTDARPKVMLPVAGKPIIEHLVNRAREAGFEKVTLIVHEMADQIKQHFGDSVEYVDQGEPKGTGHAVASLANIISQDFVLASGDALVSINELAELRNAKGTVVAGYEVDDVRNFGLLKIKDYLVLGIEEKPKESVAGLANTGFYKFTPAIIEVCQSLGKSPRGEYELTDALTKLAESGSPADFMKLSSWLEAGRPWDLLAMQKSIMSNLEGQHIEGSISNNAEIVGPVVIEKGANIVGCSRIEGPAIILAGATIGPGAFIRPFTTIGENCHIGNHCEIKSSIIMDQTNVPHLSYVGDSIIGVSCNLGAGSQVANLKTNGNDVRVHWEGKQWLDSGRRKLGCILGDGVKTGVNASIMPGTVAEGGEQLTAGTVHSGWIST